MNAKLHRKPLLGLLAAIFTSLLCIHAAADVRTWTSADGARTFEGELLGYQPESGSVIVLRSDGERMSFNQSLLSQADIAFLESTGAVTPPLAPATGGATVVAGRGGDGSQPADMSKPVQVFILMGQSNMLGFGQVAGDKDGTLEYAVKNKDLYPFLIDAEGNWTTRQDVRNVFVMNCSTAG